MSHLLLGLIDLALRSRLIGCRKLPFVSRDQTEEDLILVFGGYTPLRFSAAA